MHKTRLTDLKAPTLNMAPQLPALTTLGHRLLLLRLLLAIPSLWSQLLPGLRTPKCYRVIPFLIRFWT